jgi:phosphoglycolate phosphatase
MVASPALAMTPTPTLAWLFDIDGTLLSTEGAAREAFAQAARERLGVDDDLRSVAFAGRTEPHILADILAKHGRTFDAHDEAAFWDTVFARIRTLLVPPRGRLLAGVPELLDAVGAERAWRSALLTGNMTEMARIKLARFGIGDRFAYSACGEEAADRDALARLAVERAHQRWALPPERCVVVGDTEHDIRCARAAGAWVVAVATGSLTRGALAAHAPDLVLDDLTDTRALVEWAHERRGKPGARPS